MELTQRQNIIFKTIVERFTYCAEPVGSKTLMELLDFPVSSATIRNEMAVLERAGLLEKTHTSSGRVPSQKGYRYYVEHLMETGLSDSIRESLYKIFTDRQYSLDEVVDISSRILSEMTSLTSVVLGPDSGSQRLRHVQLVPVDPVSAVAVVITDTGHAENKLFRFSQDVSVQDLKTCTDLFNQHLVDTRLDQVADKIRSLEPLMAARLSSHQVLLEAFTAAFMHFAAEKVAVSGRSNMLAQPEFADIGRLSRLLEVMESSSLFKAWTEQDTNVLVPLGERNELIQIGDCSIVSARFQFGQLEEGHLMVVGPSRMPYGKVVALTGCMSEMIETIFQKKEGGASLGEKEEQGEDRNGSSR